jgi:hypothetical protein
LLDHEREIPVEDHGRASDMVRERLPVPMSPSAFSRAVAVAKQCEKAPLLRTIRNALAKPATADELVKVWRALAPEIATLDLYTRQLAEKDALFEAVRRIDPNAAHPNVWMKHAAASLEARGGGRAPATTTDAAVAPGVNERADRRHAAAATGRTDHEDSTARTPSLSATERRRTTMTTNAAVRVMGLRAENWMAIEAIDWPIPEAGMVVEGGNARGKTSILKALLGALTARGVEPEAVRLGEEKATLEVNLGHYSVKRVIQRNAKGGRGRVEVRREDGTIVPAPQTFLDDLLGPTIDPLDLFLAKPADRRARILAAINSKVTIAQLRGWAPDVDEKTDVSGHGLEVVERVHKLYYDRRHDQNATAKRAREEADRAIAAAEAQRKVLPDGAIPETSAARDRVDEIRAQIASLETTNREAARAERETADGRAQIEKLRAEAKALVAKHARAHGHGRSRAYAVESSRIGSSSQTSKRRTRGGPGKVLRATRRKVHSRCRSRSATRRVDARERAAGMERQAESFEAMLGRVAAKSVPQTVIDEAQELLVEAECTLGAAEQRDRAAAEERKAADLANRAATVQAEADRLDGIVRALREDAPRALLAGAGIEGLMLEEDGDVSLPRREARIPVGDGGPSVRDEDREARGEGREAETARRRRDGAARRRAARRVRSDGDRGGFQLVGSFVTGGEIAVKAVHRAEVQEGAAA